MAKVQFTTYEASESPGSVNGIAVHITDVDPFPSETVEAARAGDVLAAFESYRAKVAAATPAGAVRACSLYVLAGSSPRGLKAKVREAGTFWRVDGESQA